MSFLVQKGGIENQCSLYWSDHMMVCVSIVKYLPIWLYVKIMLSLFKDAFIVV